MYSMADGLSVARQAAAVITAWLLSQPATLAVQNVEADPNYQRVDVDLLWQTRSKTAKIEIKGDRLHRTGNFFFETHSNREKGTPGCFLYTEADYIFYYFVTPRMLYILPMPQTRDWFLIHVERFRERVTRTPVGREYYSTVGRLVPIHEVLHAVQYARKIAI